MKNNNIPISMEYEGWFCISAIKGGNIVRSGEFREHRSSDPFKNLILNQGLDRLTTVTGNLSALIGFFAVGTGTSAPSATDTQLSAQVGGMTSLGATSYPGSAPDYYARTAYTGTSEVGAYGTTNLTEVGVGGSATTLFSRALIADSSGNPVSFPINSDEQLQVSYELRIYPPLTDSVFTVDVSGTRTATVRALGVQSSSHWRIGGGGTQGPALALSSPPVSSVDWYTGGLSPVTSTTPLGTQITNSGSGRTIANNAYSNGSYARSGRISWDSSVVSSTQLRTHVVSIGIGVFQVEYNPPISKTSAQSLYLDYSFSWSRR